MHRSSPPRRRRSSCGLALIEAALALPVLLVVVSGIVQFGGLFFLKNEMINLARDAARRLAVGKMAPNEVQAFVAAGFGSWPQDFSVTVHMPDPGEPTDTDVVVAIVVPKSEAALMDIFGLFQQGNLLATVTMTQE